MLIGCATSRQQHEARAQARMAEAHAFLDQGWDASALAAFGMAIEENPNLTEAHLGMGNLYRKDGELHLAERSYERAVGIAPESFDANYYLGLVRHLQGKVEQAVSSYLRAIVISPGDAGANRNLAAAMLQLNRPADALPYAQRAVELSPSNQAAWANLGAICNLLGRYEQAIDAYRGAAEHGPAAPPILLGLGHAHLKLEHYDRALVVFERLNREGDSVVAQERIGYIRYRQKQYDAALEAYDAAVKQQPRDTASLNGLGVCLMTLYLQSDRDDRTHWRRALDAWRQSLRVDPGQTRIVDLLARYEKL